MTGGSGSLTGELLYACKYTIPSVTFKIQASVNGHIVYCGVESVPENAIPPHVVRLGIDAGKRNRERPVRGGHKE